VPSQHWFHCDSAETTKPICGRIEIKEVLRWFRKKENENKISRNNFNHRMMILKEEALGNFQAEFFFK
jgi:hypothetical protein